MSRFFRNFQPDLIIWYEFATAIGRCPVHQYFDCNKIHELQSNKQVHGKV